MKKETAVCLLSGGLDSCVTAALAARRHELALLHCNYGQITEARELLAFNGLAGYFRVPADRRLIVDIGHLKKIGGSSLTDPALEVPRAGAAGGAVPPTYVPFRNANLLAMAVSWAEVLGAGRVFIGAMEEDSSGYPDCREEFFRAFNEAVELGTRPETSIIVETPIIHFSKAEVVRWGMENGAPLHLTWSCYVSNGPRPCGRCDSCRLRRRGFREAGFEDPVEVE
ncbi:MAG: 7-cyano-7-deazaguanine synthase QueC [PVC group bacterium]